MPDTETIETAETPETDVPMEQQEPEVETEAAQPEIDWKAEARKWEKRAKENKDAADRAEEASREADEAKSRIKELEHEKERRSWLDSVHESTSVPISILGKLKADTLEELQEGASAIAAQYAHPVIPDSGSPKVQSVTKDEILAIKNEKERLAAIRDNIELFQN